MTMRLALGGAVAGMLLCAGSAFAVPTIAVDGVVVPTGFAPGGFVLESGIVDENAVGAPNDILAGVGRVDAIDDTGGDVVWQNGNNGVELAYAFNNYSVRTISATAVNFTGGNVTFYILPAGFNFATGGSVAADTALIQANSIHTWLTMNGAVEDGSGDTLQSVIFSGSALTNVFAGTGAGFFDVTGGDAGPVFDTSTFLNPFDVANGGFSDESFTSDFSTGSCPSGIAVCGSATLKANAAPEPMTVGIFGAGLAVAGLARRRKSRR